MSEELDAIGDAEGARLRLERRAARPVADDLQRERRMTRRERGDCGEQDVVRFFLTQVGDGDQSRDHRRDVARAIAFAGEAVRDHLNAVERNAFGLKLLRGGRRVRDHSRREAVGLTLPAL